MILVSKLLVLCNFQNLIIKAHNFLHVYKFLYVYVHPDHVEKGKENVILRLQPREARSKVGQGTSLRVLDENKRKENQNQSPVPSPGDELLHP